jgi:nucleoside-diphosphate-sugar epimerase
VDDPVRRRPDITRAIERLGWKPTVSLEQGLVRTIADFGARAGRFGASWFGAISL